jgi:P-type Mg2+ transporter
LAQARSNSIFARRRLGGRAQTTRFWEGSPAAPLLDEVSRVPADTALRMLASDPLGLSEVEVQRRLRTYGPNEVAHERPVPWPVMLLHNLKNPFVVVLAVLGLVSYVTEDRKGTMVVAVMVALSVLMRFIQEFRSSRAAQVLRAMVSTTATVTRRYASGSADGAAEVVSQKREIWFDELVPGDVVHLSAGDMLPADVRFLGSKDLFVSQAALTGEAMPVEKYDTLGPVAAKVAGSPRPAAGDPLDQPTLGFMGTDVLGGSATAVVVATGRRTYFGSLAKSVIGHRSLTSFDKGVNRVTWVLIRFMLMMVPVVFLLNGLAKGNWVEAFLFATAVAVGLTPEMLPMVVTANLARGAVALARQKVIVKRLNAIQNFGAMDILCTDKTGTLTQDRIVLEEHLDLQGREDHRVLEYAYVNSYYQTGLKNLLDRAILAHGELEHELHMASDYTKVDEVPFDFARRRMSVVVEQAHRQHLLICKGAVEEVLEICSGAEDAREVVSLSKELRDHVIALAQSLNENGLRVVAVAYKTMPATDRTYSVEDEQDLVVMGLIAFLDPPKETAAPAIAALHGHGVAVKILTGDNEIVTRRICRQVGLPVDTVVRGPDLEGLRARAIEDLAERATVFAKLTPLQKARIVRALQARGHTVGFLGDGINDAAALREADVGISVDGATDIARESADLILLEKSLLVLEAGVLKGREVYGNIIKYIKMTASSNFGNVFSVLIASAFLPFLPMLPLQLLVQNLFYDLSQLALPWDRMDREFLENPRTWEPSGIARFMVFIGPISSVFDAATFFVLWFVLHANGAAHQGLFQSGWFIEGLLSQTLIVHMIRTQRIPFLQSIAAAPVLVSTAAIMAVGIALPFSRAGGALGMMELPWAYFWWLAVILLGYCGLTQAVKVWYLRRFGSWL